MIERSTLEWYLALAEGRVVQGARRLVQQRDLIDRLDRSGRDATKAKLLLVTSENAQGNFMEDRERLRATLADAFTW